MPVPRPQTPSGGGCLLWTAAVLAVVGIILILLGMPVTFITVPLGLLWYYRMRKEGKV